MRFGWLRARLSAIDLVPAELIGLVSLAYMTVVLWWPGTTFTRSAVYSGMQDVTREGRWALMALVLLIAKVVVILGEMRRARRAVQIVIVFWWTWLALLAWQGNHLSIMPGIYISLALVGLMARVDVREHEGERADGHS